MINNSEQQAYENDPAFKSWNKQSDEFKDITDFDTYSAGFYDGQQGVKELVKALERIIEECRLGITHTSGKYISSIATEALQSLSGKEPANKIPDDFYPGYEYQNLFNWLHDKNFIALQSEMQELIDIVHRDFPKEQSGEQQERFKKPTDQQVVKAAILFNDGLIDKKQLSNMVALADFIIDRLYENGDMTIPSSKEK